MSEPLIDLASPTGLFVHWGWFLVTRANAIVYLLLAVVFVAGMTVRLPRARHEVDEVFEQRTRAGR